jgi:hypothetical protein
MKIALVLALIFAPIANPVPTGEPAAPPPNYAMGVLADQPPVPLGYFVGTATWYDADRRNLSTWYTRAGIDLYGAIGAEVRAFKPHAWRTSWNVEVVSLLTGRSVIVQVVDVCTCYGQRANPNDDRLIDLSPEVWQALGVPLGRGVMPIALVVLP